ncbi:MAG: FecR domain-containing protein [Gemmatimonadetes bacterium]|nr:FecR domain-containing protein [Gemmatimonadota bacterium]
MDDSTLFRAHTRQLSEDDLRAVTAWRAASPWNEARYQEVGEVLALTQRSDAGPRTRIPDPSEILALAARREGKRASNRKWRAAVGAITGIAALLAVAVAMDRAGFLGRDESFGFEEMVTGDQAATVSLRDGSVMRLAPRSRARIRVREGEREVHLSGRAFFSVAKRNGTPFVVRTAGGDVTVLGTQFDVNATNDDVRLVVVEGRVALQAARGGETRVEGGQVARVVEGQLQPTLAAAEPRAATEWVGRFLVWHAAPLGTVLADLERVYGARVTVADSTLMQQTVTNTFTDRTLDEVVRVTCAILGAECVVQGQDVQVGQPQK